MHAVECDRCGTAVLVSKFSHEQTSIQWQTDSSACPKRSELQVGQTCPALSDTIRDAVLAGTLGVEFRDE